MYQNNIFDQNLLSSDKYLRKVSASCEPIWQFWLKSWIGWMFLEKVKVLVLTVCCGQNDNFGQNLGQKWQFFCRILDRAKFFGKSEIFSLKCLHWTKITILSKICDRVKNIWEKCLQWTKMTNLIKFLDWVKVFRIFFFFFWKKWYFLSGHVRNGPKWQWFWSKSGIEWKVFGKSVSGGPKW